MTATVNDSVIERWHRVLKSRDSQLLHELLAEDAVFHSPVMHTPQAGRDRALQYLAAASQVLLNSSFGYVRELVGEQQAALEFTVTIDDVVVNGIDLIRWNEAQQITEFKVMLRPLKAIQTVQEKMARMLEQAPAGE